MKIKAILLAAGNSSRFGGNKLLSLYRGKKLITYALDVLKESNLECVVVSQYEEIENLSKQYGFAFIQNEAVSKGVSHSIHLGVSFFKDADALLFLVGDQPYIRLKTLQKMIAEVDNTHIICCASQNRMGNPAIFPKCYFEKLLALKGDHGGKLIIQNNAKYLKTVCVNDIELWDIDVYEDMKECR